MRHVLVDTNVVLDVVLNRGEFAPAGKAVFAEVAARRLEASLTATTLTTIFYIARKVVGTVAAQREIAALLATFEVAPVNAAILRAALDRGWPDFEDAVQDAAAVAAGIDTIVARDPRGFDGSTRRILDPAALADELAGSP